MSAPLLVRRETSWSRRSRSPHLLAQCSAVRPAWARKAISSIELERLIRENFMKTEKAPTNTFKFINRISR